MIVQFKDGFLEALKEYGSSIRITTALVDGLYKKFESLWGNNTLTFTLEGSSEGESVVIYYSDYNDNRIGEAFTITLEEGSVLTDTNYFNVKFPEDTRANIIGTCTNPTIKFLEDPYQIEGCNIFTTSTGIPTRESYEKHYRRRVLSENTVPSYLDCKGEKVYSSVLYKDYKSLTIQALDVPCSDSIYYVSNSKSITISGTCVYDMYRVENGAYTLIEEDCIEGIDVATIVGISGEGYSISGQTITFNIDSNTERSSFKGYIKFKDELREGTIKTIESDAITFITYLGWSVEYSSNLKEEEDGNIVFLFDSKAGSTGLNEDAKLTLYSDADVSEDYIEITGDSSIFDYFSFSIKKDTTELSEQNKYVVEISTKRSTEINGQWFPLGPSGNSELLLCTLSIRGSSDQVHFYCVQRAKYPLELVGSTALTGIGTKMTGDIVVSGQEIDNYSNWDYEIEGNDTLVDLHSGKKIGNTLNIISRKNPSCTPDRIKFFRVGPSGEVISDSWRDVMYCSRDNSIELEVIVSGKSIGGTPYSYNGKELFIFKRGITTPAYIRMNDPGKIETENTAFEFKWLTDEGLKITPKESANTPSSDWYPKTEKGEPVLNTIGGIEFYCVVAPDLRETIEAIGRDGKVIKEIDYQGEEKSREVFLASTVSSNFNYWRPIGLDSRVSIFFSNYINGYGVPFDRSITLETQYEAINSRDITFEPFIVQRVAGRYPNAFDFFSDWRNQMLVDSTYSLPISIVGKDPSDSIKVLSYNPDGTLSEIKDDESLVLDYIGLYKLFIKSVSTYRVSIKGVVPRKQYFYFFDTLTSQRRDGVLSIDKGSFNVVTGEEICFAFYGGEPGGFEREEQILGTYIQVEDLLSGETINIKLKRVYPDNNIRKISPKSSDIILRNSDKSVEVSFESNVETNFGIPTFSNSLFSAKGTLLRKLVSSEIWTRGYEGHTYELECPVPAPEKYPIEAVTTLRITNPGEYNSESIEYDIFKLPTDPDFTLNRNTIGLHYLAGSSGRIVVTVRDDARYNAYWAVDGNEIKISGSYSNDLVNIYNDGDTWFVEEISGKDYTGEENIFYGTLIFKSYIDKDNFIVGRSYLQSEVDDYVPGIRKSIPVYRMSNDNSVSSIFGDKTNIDRRGELREYECSFITNENINTEAALLEQPHLSSMVYEGGTLNVRFKSRLERGDYTGDGIPLLLKNEVGKFSSSEVTSDFYVYEGNSKVSFTDLKQDKWERGIRISGGVSPYPAVYLGENSLGESELEYNDNTISFYVASVLLEGNMESGVERCSIELTGSGANCIVAATVNQSSYTYGYQVILKFPENNSYSTNYGPFNLTITDSYGNKVTKIFYKKYRSVFNLHVTDESKIGSDGVVSDLINETAFSSSGASLHPHRLFILTDAPDGVEKTFSVSGSITTDVGHSRESSSLIQVNTSNSTEVSYQGQTFRAYEITSLTSKIDRYAVSDGSFDPSTDGFGHISYNTSLIIYMYCCGGTSSGHIMAHSGFCEVSLEGPYKTYYWDNNYGVDFSILEGAMELSKYHSMTSYDYFASNIKQQTSGYYNVDNSLNIVYLENSPRKYDTPEQSFYNYGYYSGFKLWITRKEYTYDNGTWKLVTKKIHTITSPDSLLIEETERTIGIKDDKGIYIRVPAYIMANSRPSPEVINGQDVSCGGGSTTTNSDYSSYEQGFLFVLPAPSFSIAGNTNTCSRTFKLSSKGIDDFITFTVNFEIHL